MKQIISIVCIVLMLAVLLVGCGRKDNVSDNTEGRITETTTHTTASPTTERTTTERATTERATTSATTESTSASVGGSETVDTSEGVTEEGGAVGRIRRGIMGNERY